MKLHKQIFSGYVLIAMLVLVVGLTGYNGLSAITQSFDSAINRTQPVLTALERIRMAATMLAFSVAVQSINQEAAPAGNAPKLQIPLTDIAAAVADYHRLVEKYFPHELGTAKEIEDSVRAFEKAVEALPAYDHLREAVAFHRQLVQVSAVLAALNDLIAKAAANEEREFHEQQEKVHSQLMKHLAWLVAAVSGSILIAIVGGKWHAMRMVRPIGSLRQAALSLGTGNLEARAELQTADEIGDLARAFNQMGEELSRTLVSRDYVESVIDSLNEGVMVVDQTGRILRSNLAMRQISNNVAMAQIEGRALDEVFVTDAMFGNLRDDLLTQRTFECSLRIKTNPDVIVSVSVSPLLKEKFINERVLVIKDITEQKKTEEQVRHLAFYDRLTKLPNRHMLDDRLNHALAASKRSKFHGALMFLDLDNFKALNDKHGHDAGDLLLIEVAERLTGCVRQIDTAARFGGDEFVVMLEELDIDKDKATAQALMVAEKIRVALANPYLLKIRKSEQEDFVVEHSCTACIGVVLFGNHKATQEDILKWADIAMYQAKNSGANLIRFHAE